MKTFIGASLPLDLYPEFVFRTERGFPGGKTGLIKEALRFYFAANPLTGAELQAYKEVLKTSDNVVLSQYGK